MQVVAFFLFFEVINTYLLTKVLQYRYSFSRLPVGRGSVNMFRGLNCPKSLGSPLLFFASILLRPIVKIFLSKLFCYANIQQLNICFFNNACFMNIDCYLCEVYSGEEFCNYYFVSSASSRFVAVCLIKRYDNECGHSHQQYTKSLACFFSCLLYVNFHV